jgi:hypothetical protein
MFEFNTGDPDAFLAAAARRGVSARVLRHGERVTLGA